MADLLTTLQSVLGDAYRIERELPAGGMSRLVVASDTSAFGRLVVIKVLPPELVSPQSTARFKREVDVTAHLQHPNILPVLGAGVRDGLLYYIMPYVEGESLRRRLERGPPYALPAALRLLREVADALAYANARGVVHRDIKPENILLADEHGLVADFGIARGAMSPVGGTIGTATGVSLGTLGYMAPEQLFAGGTADARADIYSLGVVAYEVLAGTPPFVASTAAALVTAHVSTIPRPLSDLVPGLPPVVSDAVARALAKEPDDRPQDAGVLRDAFESALSMLQTGSMSRAAAPARSRAWRVGVPLTIAALAAAGAVALLTSRPGATDGLDQNRILVAPFNVPEDVRFTNWDGAELWSQTMRNVATRNLDGMGPLTTVDAATVTREWKGRTDAASARAHARDHQAGLAVYGDVLTGIGDTLIARAQILDVSTGKTIDSVSVAGSEARPDLMASALALRVLDVLRAIRKITATPNAGLGSRSPSAVKAFAKGEGFYRDTRWDSALVYYERAIALDTTFALALRRAGQSVAWLRDVDDSVSRAYLRKAGALNRNLSQHDSLLITADSISSTLPDDADPAWLPQARRLFAVWNAAVQLYPSDPEVWFGRGDAGYHHGYGPGISLAERQILGDFARAIELNRDFAPAYEHAVELSYGLNVPDTARIYAELYLALNPNRDKASTIRLVKQIGDYAAAQSAELDVFVDTASAPQLALAWLQVRRWVDNEETGVRIARALTKRGYADGLFPDPRLRLSLELGYRGQLQEGGQLLLQLGDLRNSMLVDFALLGAFPEAQADSMFRRWLEDYASQSDRRFPWWTLPWWGMRRDVAAIARIQELARRSARDAEPGRQSIASYVVESSQGYLELARGDSVAALRTLRALPPAPCVECYQDRFLTARLLSNVGEQERAALLLDERPNRLLTPTEIPMLLERARVATLLQKEDKALDAYARVARAWSRADPFLRPRAQGASMSMNALQTRGRVDGGKR